MKNTSAAPRRERGFTLIEMLIVVAIIAVLVAVSIPLVNNSLERTREAADMANERAAKAEATIYYLGEGELPADIALPLCYDAVSGKLIQYDYSNPPASYGKCERHKGGYIAVSMMEDGEVRLAWFGTEKTGDESFNPHLYPPITYGDDG